jgi:dienelactone hydrolase
VTLTRGRARAIVEVERTPAVYGRVVHQRRALLVLLAAMAPVVAPASSAAAQSSPAASATLSYTFVDSTRSTPCTGANERTLKVTVVTPDADGPSPVVLVAPGSGASQRAVAKADAAALAARGYVGVALDFPCTNAPGFSTLDPTVALDIYHQPGDVSFVLTNLLALSTAPGNPLSELLDPARVGLVGTSSGAITGLLLFNTCCTDARIRAMEIVKGFPPPTSGDLPVNGVYDWSRPIAAYFWSGCLDVVTPHDTAAAAFAQLGPPKAFVTDPTGGHDTPPIFPNGTRDAFLDRFVAGDISPATAVPFLAADGDPYFAYDLGAPIPPHGATAGCASPEGAPEPPPVEVPVVLAPTFTG